MRVSIALLCGLLLWAPGAFAENSTKVNGYTIHHNALTTDALSPDVASAYGIQRSHNRGMVNISIIKDREGSTGTPVSGQVRLQARNLIGQTREIPLREIREQDAVYYIADFLVADRERLVFSIEAQPRGEAYPLKARFEQEFFTN